MRGGDRIDLLVINDNVDLAAEAPAVFSRWGIDISFEPDQNGALARIYESPPDAILLDRAAAPLDGLEFGRMIKGDHALAHIPVLVVVDRGSIPDLSGIAEIALDDFLLDWEDLEILALRVRLCHERSARELDANPLSRLGGNNTITRAIEQRLAAEAEFAVAYVDLDNFKPFNDCYGFLRGDEVIRMTARIITTAVHDAGVAEDSLVGHVGGDDFVFIVPADAAQSVCESLIPAFDLTIRSFYDEKELRNGGIRANNRRGQPEFFGLVSVSIAVAVARPGEIEHPGQFSTITGELKKRAKAKAGSSFVIDRRRKGELIHS